MGNAVAVVHEGCVSRFRLRPIERKSLYGFKRRVALDAQENECASALLTHDGRFLLPSGSTAEAYLDANGDTVKPGELVAMDTNGNPLPTLTPTLDRPQAVKGLVSPEEFLGHVVTKTYLLEAEALDPALNRALRNGAVFRIPFRPRATHTDTPAFLLANEHGVFLVQAEPCGFEYVGLEQTASEADEEHEGAGAESDEFAFDLDWEDGHAIA